MTTFKRYSPDVYMIFDRGVIAGNLVRTTNNRWVINDAADRTVSAEPYRTLKEAKADAERVLS